MIRSTPSKILGAVLAAALLTLGPALPATAARRASSAGHHPVLYASVLGGDVEKIDSITGQPLGSVPGVAPIDYCCGTVNTLAVAPDGRRLYALEQAGLVVVDTRTDQVVGQGSGIDGTPSLISLNATGTLAALTGPGRDEVDLVDTATLRVVARIPVPFAPCPTAFAGDGHTLFVGACVIDNPSFAIARIDLASRTVAGSLPSPGGVVDLKMSADGAQLFAATCGGLLAIPATTFGPVETILSGLVWSDCETAMAMGRLGRKLGVPLCSSSEFGLYCQTNVLDVGTASLGQGGAPCGGHVVAADDGSALLVRFTVDDLVRVDPHTGDCSTVPGVQGLSGQLVIAPDQAPVAHLIVGPAAAGAPTTFDARSSTVAFGTISAYRWDFGDGTTAVTSTPVTTHTYAAPGTYHVVLVETDSAGTSLTRVYDGRQVLHNGGLSALTRASLAVG
jgi:hypothetical protein